MLAGLGLVSYSCEATTRRQANGQLTRRRYRSQHRESHHSPTQLPTRAGRRATSGDLSRKKLVLCRKRIHSLFAIETRQTTRGSQESLLGGDGVWLTTTLDCILWSWPSTCICQQNKCLEGIWNSSSIREWRRTPEFCLDDGAGQMKALRLSNVCAAVYVGSRASPDQFGCLREIPASLHRRPPSLLPSSSLPPPETGSSPIDVERSDASTGN